MGEIVYKNIRQRDEYCKSIERLIDKLNARAENFRRTSIEKETLRKQFVDTLGYPLNCYGQFRQTAVKAKTEPLMEDEAMIATRYQLEVMEDFWFSGILYEPKEKSSGKNALVIAQHGGDGSSEVVGSLVHDSANYNHMVKRVMRKGISVFAPQLLLWKTEIYGNEGYDRVAADQALKQYGGSITALEIFCIMRSIDYLCGIYDENRIGMIGLSYGGMYTLYTAAADTRIKSALSSCWYGEGLKHLVTDWKYFNQLNIFSTGEVGSLVLPRKLYVELGTDDELFPPENAGPYSDKLKEYAKKENCPDSLKISIFNGGHELDKSDEGIKFFIDGLMG
jgi:dienelactone hydrolase